VQIPVRTVLPLQPGGWTLAETRSPQMRACRLWQQRITNACTPGPAAVHSCSAVQGRSALIPTRRCASIQAAYRQFSPSLDAERGTAGRSRDRSQPDANHSQPVPSGRTRTEVNNSHNSHPNVQRPWEKWMRVVDGTRKGCPGREEKRWKGKKVSQEVEDRTERLDHVGRGAEMCREAGRAAWLDAQAGENQRAVSGETAVVAMILNGLGFRNRQVSLVPAYVAKHPWSMCWEKEAQQTCATTMVWGERETGSLSMIRRSSVQAWPCKPANALGFTQNTSLVIQRRCL
jgi:hypothetical protein